MGTHDREQEKHVRTFEAAMDTSSFPVRVSVQSDTERLLYEDGRFENFEIAQLAVIYDAVVAAGDAFAPYFRDLRVTPGDCEDALGDLDGLLCGLQDLLHDQIEGRAPTDDNDRFHRNRVLMAHALRTGVGMAGLALLAEALSTEERENG